MTGYSETTVSFDVSREATGTFVLQQVSLEVRKENRLQNLVLCKFHPSGVYWSAINEANLNSQSDPGFLAGMSDDEP